MNVPGLIKDPRSPDEKERDYNHNDIYGATPVTWLFKPQAAWRTYSTRDQGTSSSCVAQAAAKALETRLTNVMSATPFYQKRLNSPGIGMYLQNMGDLALTIGTQTDSKIPSQYMSDEQMDDLPITIPLGYKVTGYIFLDPKNIDQIASVIQQGLPVLMTFNTTYKEWQDVPKTNMFSWITGFFGHCICGIDTTLYNEEKSIIIDDSWGNATTIGNGGQRVITESYLLARCTGAMYFTFGPILPMQTVTITRDKTTTKETTGTLKAVVAGAEFSCKTLELPWLDNQRNISCIPPGKYMCQYTYSPKMDKYTYEVLNVAGRTGIRIHVANYYSDLLGCIGLGSGIADLNSDKQIDITNSRKTIEAFEGFMGKKAFTLVVE